MNEPTSDKPKIHTPKPLIMILALDVEKEDVTEQMYETFLIELEGSAEVRYIAKAQETAMIFCGVRRKTPTAILCGETSIAAKTFISSAGGPPVALAEAAKVYVNHGGILVVMGILFTEDWGNDADEPPPDISPVFSSFGLQWRAGFEGDTTAMLNTSMSQFDTIELPEIYNQTSLNLRGVDRSQSVHLPSDRRPPSSEVEWPQTPAACTVYGHGKLCYLGDREFAEYEDWDREDFNSHSPTLRLFLRMVGVR